MRRGVFCVCMRSGKLAVLQERIKRGKIVISEHTIQQVEIWQLGTSVDSSKSIIQRRKVKMEITTKQLKRVDLVTVSGRIDSATAIELDSVLKSIVDAGRFRICMDLKDLEYISSAGVKILISILKTCKRWNRGDLHLANMPPYIAGVFELVPFQDDFDIIG